VREWPRQIAMVVVLLGVVVAAWLTVSNGFVAGGLTLASVCVLAALLRAVLPTAWVGTLAVRRTTLDVAVLVGLATVVVVLTLSVPTR
jgi:hypothetical protein